MTALFVLALAFLPAGQTVRVGVFSLFRPQRVVVKPVPGGVLRVAAGGRTFDLEGAQSAAFRLNGDSLDAFIRRELIPVSSARAAARDGGAAEFVLSVPGRIERRFRGALEVTANAGAIQAVVELDLETAVASVIAAESPPRAAMEALMAQAVAARSFYLATRRRHPQFDFCDTTHCQFLRDPPPGQSPARRAAEGTAGLVLRYQGAVVGALYSASCGGRTRSLEEVGMPAGDYPFFPVDCDACRRGAREWTVRLSGAEAASILARPHSEAARLEIVRRRGWSALPGNHYEIERAGDGIVLRGRGSGHGVGLCQLGAAAMAAAGADFRAILARYFPATALAAP